MQIARSDSTWTALDKAYSRHMTDVRDYVGGDRAPAWSYGQVMVAALDCSDRTKFDTLFQNLELYRKGDGYAAVTDGRHGVGDRYYDDNGWIGLALMQAWHQYGDARYLETAQRTFRFLQTGLQSDGGMLWKEGGDLYAMPAFGSCMETALQLYQATGQSQYLTFAKTLDDYVEKHFVMPSGLYADSFHRGQNDLNTTVWSYNQGIGIGTNVLLYRATGDKTFLDRARSRADAAMRWGQSDTLWQQPQAFNAILMRNLLQLDSAWPEDSYRTFVTSYADRLWSQGVDPQSHLLKTTVGMGYYGSAPGGVIDQAAVTQMLALPHWPRPHEAVLT